MSFVRTFVHHPRKLFLRRALFQIHLWAGVLLSLYVMVIALTGSILVFRSELTRTQLPASLSPYNPAHTASMSTVVAHFQSSYPQGKISNLTLPSPVFPAWLITGTTADHKPLTLIADPATAAITTQPKNWVDWIYDLHVYLLMNHAYGMQINAIGASILLILCMTGLVIWWPGIKVWTRGIAVNFRHNWRRINFDAHSAIGIWTLLLVSWWSVSGIYFGWYKQVTATVSAFSPLVGMISPKAPPQAPDTHHRVTLDSLLAAVQRVSPNGRLYSLSDPTLSGSSVYALLDLRTAGDFSHRDIVTLSTVDAHVLTVWHYGDNKTLGDWIIWAMHPIHFGTLWGIAIKIVWALLGFSLAMLSATGVLMYWNRFLKDVLRAQPSHTKSS